MPASVFNAWRSLQSGMAEPGFAAEEFLSAQLAIDEGPRAAGQGLDTGHGGDRWAELIRRLEADPRVAQVTFALVNPGDEDSAWIETQASARKSTSRHEVRFNRVDVNFFRTFGVPILAGRALRIDDIVPDGVEAGGSVVVNQSFAQRIFGGDARTPYPLCSQNSRRCFAAVR